ncbi:MAG: hypothetical protein AB1461_12500 [Thermodesulfobacteriota bacterium]
MSHFSKKKGSSCPFWIECNSQCLRRLGGVYIPLQYYVETFCKTREFVSCGHYLLANLLTREKADSFEHAHNT